MNIVWGQRLISGKARIKNHHIHCTQIIPIEKCAQVREINTLDFEVTIPLGTSTLVTSILYLNMGSRVIPNLHPTSVLRLGFLSHILPNHPFIFPFNFPRLFNTDSTTLFPYFCSTNTQIHLRILMNSFPTAFSTGWCETFQINDLSLAKL